MSEFLNIVVGGVIGLEVFVCGETDVLLVVDVVGFAELAVVAGRACFLVVLCGSQAYFYNGFFLGILNLLVEANPLKAGVFFTESLSGRRDTSSQGRRKAGVK